MGVPGSAGVLQGGGPPLPMGTPPGVRSPAPRPQRKVGQVGPGPELSLGPSPKEGPRGWWGEGGG